MCTQYKGKPSNSHIRPMVTNPLYDTGENIYEELPDPEVENGQVYMDMAPPLPSARNEKCPTITSAPPEKESASDSIGTSLTPEIKQGKFTMLNVPRPRSTGDLSSCSVEDCYTVMSPAGDLTMLPRNRHSGSHNMASGGAGPTEGRSTLHVI